MYWTFLIFCESLYFRLGEVCSHVAALLFKVEMGVKIGLTKSSSTSKSCEWNCTFRKEVNFIQLTLNKARCFKKKKNMSDVILLHSFN